LPEPAPARINIGPVRVSTASFWGGLRFFVICSKTFMVIAVSSFIAYKYYSNNASSQENRSDGNREKTLNI
jgi:hypothetical protein